MIAAHKALVHLEAISDHYQALHRLALPETIIRSAILAQKVNRGIADDIAKWGKIRPERPDIFKPAFSKAEQRHL